MTQTATQAATKTATHTATHPEVGETGEALAIRARSLAKSFGGIQAVRGIDLDIRPGEIVAFLGPNGAGKTTTIDMILGLAEPSGGQVQVYGQAPRTAIAHGLVSAVLQTGALLKDITVRETLELVGSLFPHAAAVDSVMQRAGITQIAGRKVAKCSGGEQQRLRFAIALLPDPQLLILDEPTSGMDVEGRRTFWAAIRQDAAAGRTILFATHYLEEADEYADRVVLLRQGQIVADGTAAQIKAMSAGRTVRASIPAIDSVLVESIPGATSVEVRGETVRVQSSDSDAVARYLLNHTPARDLEIEARGIEDAFLALTSTTEGTES